MSTTKKGSKKMNKIIRNELKKAKMKQWQLADLLEISESALVRKLRYELSDEERERILAIIRKEKKE